MKKQKPAYRKVRLPAIKVAGGGAHVPAKGGKYRRGKEKERSRKEVRTELE